jgi:hypothetical protein
MLLGQGNHVPIDESDNEDDEEVCMPVGEGKSFLFGSEV